MHTIPHTQSQSTYQAYYETLILLAIETQSVYMLAVSLVPKFSLYACCIIDTKIQLVFLRYHLYQNSLRSPSSEYQLNRPRSSLLNVSISTPNEASLDRLHAKVSTHLVQGTHNFGYLAITISMQARSCRFMTPMGIRVGMCCAQATGRWHTQEEDEGILRRSKWYNGSSHCRLISSKFICYACLQEFLIHKNGYHLAQSRSSKSPLARI